MLDFLIDISLKTGFILIPLVLSGIFGWYFLLELYFFLLGQRRPSKILKQETFIKALETDKFNPVLKRLGKSQTTIYAAFIDLVIKNVHQSERHRRLQSRLFIGRHLRPYFARMHSVKFIASMAPLLGLLGTVNGMSNTFEIIAVYGRSNPVLLADGISEALLTTQLGLIIAFPLLFLYVWMRHQLVLLQSNMEDILTEVSHHKKIELERN